MKRLYGLNNDQMKLEKLDKWYTYLKENRCRKDDCENYIQGNLAGCNIMSRNILVSEKRVNYINKCPLNESSTTEPKKYIKIDAQ